MPEKIAITPITISQQKKNIPQKNILGDIRFMKQCSLNNNNNKIYIRRTSPQN